MRRGTTTIYLDDIQRYQRKKRLEEEDARVMMYEVGCGGQGE